MSADLSSTLLKNSNDVCLTGLGEGLKTPKGNQNPHIEEEQTAQ